MARRALFVIDTQVDFNDAEGSLTSYHRSDDKMRAIAALIGQFHREGGPVVATVDTHPPINHPENLSRYRQMLAETMGAAQAEAYEARAVEIYNEELRRYPPHCEFGTGGWEPTRVIAEAFSHLGDDLILIQKPSYRLVDGHVLKGPAELIGKSGAEVLDYLKTQGVEEVVVTGLITPVCVLAASESAVQAGFRATVDEAAVDSYDEASHRDGLQRITAAGARVIPV